MQPADADDLVQEVFTRLVRGMPRFHYDAKRSFRSYLKSLARYAMYDLRRQNLSQAAGGTDESQDEMLENTIAGLDLEQRLEEEFDRELLARAMTEVAARVAPTTWEAFRLQAVEGLPASEVAARLEMKIASVYKARSNVVKRLQFVLKALEEQEDSLLPENPGGSDSESPKNL
jgi:RNA polymerase sigma-70 factor (ECF subfamily)